MSNGCVPAKWNQIKASANSNSVAWEGTWGYSPLGLIIKLLIWPLHTIISNRFAHHLFSWVSTMESDRGEKWVNAVLIHSRYTKESNSVHMCYHKSVSTESIQCLARKQEEGSKFWKAVTQHMKSIQQFEQDSSSSGVPVPKATTDVVSLLFSSSSSEVLEILCSTGTSTGICMIFFRHWTLSFFQFSRHWCHTVEKLLW